MDEVPAKAVHTSTGNIFAVEQHTCAMASGVQQGSAVSQAGGDLSDRAPHRPPASSCQHEAQQDKKVDSNRPKTGGTNIFFCLCLLNFPVAEMQSSQFTVGKKNVPL